MEDTSKNNKPEINFIGKFPLFAILSSSLVILSIFLFITFGLNYGIDFSGGYELQVSFPENITEGQIRKAIEPLGLGDIKVQRFGNEEQNEFLIMARKNSTLNDIQKEELKKFFIELAGDKDKLIAWNIAESGESIKARFSTFVSEVQITEKIKKLDINLKKIIRSGRDDEPEFTLYFVSLSDQITEVIKKEFSIANDIYPVKRVEFVGPQVGEQLRNQGIMAIMWALFFILLYVGVRFDLHFSPGAVIALLHDVLITVGIFSFFQIEFNLPIIAAILAIVGYSLNDTIVVYDRIRENLLVYRGRDLRSLVNTSLNQTLSRTLLTSITTILVILALLIFGGGVIRDFSLTLFIGVLVGTYSSIAVATPVYMFLNEYKTSKKAVTTSITTN